MSQPSAFPHLLSPRSIGPRVARNRVWMTPHTTGLMDEGFTDAQIAYYEERAAGGAAVVTLQAMPVHRTGIPYHRLRLTAVDERIVADYSRLREAISAQGAILLVQLWHRGRQMDGIASRRPVWAPSPVPCSVNREIPHAMSLAEIDELVEGYVQGAMLAVAGGVDGIEIHGIAHGYLLGQFLSPATNHRTDAFGGSEENRLRLLMRILEEVRAVVPPSTILGMRISSDEGIEGGLDTAAWADIAGRVAETGAIDYLSVTQGTYLNKMLMYSVPPGPPGYQFEATKQIKLAVGDLPVVVAGRITTPELAEAALESDVADFVGLSRQLIADPAWAKKVAEGRHADIRPCVGANWCYTAVNRATLACAHNPAVGHERSLGRGTLTQVQRPVRLTVIGGGPAGLRAAYTAARRGMQVQLREASDQLGGQLRLLRGTPYAEYAGIVDWLIQQLDASQVEVRLNDRVESLSDHEALGHPDHVIVATGARYLRTGWSAVQPTRWGGDAALPGADQWNVFDIEQILTADPREIPNRVVIFDDTGTRDPLVAAEVLAVAGHPVIVASRSAVVGQDLVETQDHGFVYARLRRLGVEFIPRVIPTSIDGDRVTFRDLDTSKEWSLDDADAVVLSTGKVAVNQLEGTAHSESLPVTLVGDCVAPRRYFNAIWEAELAVRAI